MSSCREGINKSLKTHKSNFQTPDPASARSKRRAKRGFKGIETSRIHKRAEVRLKFAQTFQGKRYKAGENVELSPKCFVRAGGALRYH
jgi:hypothetical protein